MSWSREIELFPHERELKPSGRGGDVLQRLAQAWRFRQVDTQRAQKLVQQLLADLEQGTALSEEERARALARTQLIQAEVCALQLQLGPAQEWLDQAIQGFERLGDVVGQSDAKFLAHYLAADRGNAAQLRESLLDALALAEQAGDDERVLLLQATVARSELFRDQKRAREAWSDRLPQQLDGLSTATAAAVADYRGLQDGLASDYVQAVHWFVQGYERALESGQIRRAISIASNLGFTYTSMSDYQTAIEWLKRGLEIARKARWPGAISLALAQTGDALRHVGQTEAARDLLLECLQILTQHPTNRSVLLALKYLGQTEMDRHQPAAALVQFDLLAERAHLVDSSDLRGDAEWGRARALLALGRLDEAQTAALAASEVAQTQRERGTLVEIWWVMAQIEQARGSEVGARLEWLDKALTQADAIDGYLPPPDLLDAAADAHAQAGQFERAYAMARRAGEVRQASFTAEASRRSSALHARHQIETMRAEREHLRQLAESEAGRVRALQSVHEVLVHLSTVGKEITAELDASKVFEVLERHVHAMLQATSLTIYLADEAAGQLICAFGIENGQSFSDPPIDVQSPESYSALCWRERRELVLGERELPLNRTHVPGTTVMNSMIFAPLVAGDRAIGVMTVQTDVASAYGEREQLIFRSLCAYGAIALDNARAYQRLSELQRHVIAQEKLAALGAMVAGVAHELNTPIGNSLLAASTLLGDTQELIHKVDAQALRRADWQTFAQRSVKGLEVIEHSMKTAARLVDSFKQVAVDRSSQQRRGFLLSDVCVQVVQSMGQQMQKAGVAVSVKVPETLRMDSFPGPLGQVLSHLLGNALLHAFEGQAFPQIEIGAEPLGRGRLRLWVQDNGNGVPAALHERVFEPFFTTRFGQGGNGLGLSVCHNIVSSILGGTICVQGHDGQGARFVMELPLVA